MGRIVYGLSMALVLVMASSCDESKPCDCEEGGTCYAEGEQEADNPCRVCDPAQSTTALSALADGEPCDDGFWCNGDDLCRAGTCSDHLGNPCVGVGLCDEDAEDCNGTCDSGCAIDYYCYADGETNPEEVCEFCDVSQSTTTWSANDGATCDDDRFCNGTDTCDGGSCSVHSGDPCTPPEMCNESDDTCDDTCNGCTIGAICFGDGNTNPTNVCQVCDVATSTTDWTDNDGVSCEDGQFCNGTDTCNGGVCEHSGDPCDVTETCDASTASCVYTYGGCLAPIVVTTDATFFGADFAATFADGLDLSHASCDGGLGLPAAGSPEAVFEVSLNAAESVTVREVGGLDALITVQSTCSDTAPCLLADDATEDAMYTASAAETVYVVVSAKDASPVVRDFEISFIF